MDGEHLMMAFERILGDVLGPRWISEPAKVTPEQWGQIKDYFDELVNLKMHKEVASGHACSGNSEGE